MEQVISAQQLEDAYDAYGAAVYRLAVSYLGYADAEDVTQETFCRLLYRAPPFSDEEHRKRWLLQVAANLCRNQLKCFWRKQVTQLEENTFLAIAPEEMDALNAVMALPEKYKLPIHLHYYEGYSVAEIAEILRLGQSAVKMRLKRGRELLKIELEGSN